MKIKKLMVFLLAGITILSLAACSETADSSSPSDKITIWPWDESFNIKAVNKAAEVYAEINPDVEVEVVTMVQDDIVAMLNISLSSSAYDGLPDIVLIEDLG